MRKFGGFLVPSLLCVSLLSTARSLACPAGAVCCNNVEACDLPVNEILFGMVHNAMASPSAGFVFFPNHLNDPIVESLEYGYRGLSLDLCNCDGEFVFCHGGEDTGCGIGRRDPIDTFTQINEWLTINPANVIMIWLEINEPAGGPISLEDVESIVNAVPLGNSNRTFADRLYKRNLDDKDWPTLSQLIEAEQQILFFFQGGPNDAVVPPAGLHYFYAYGMSTDWSYASVEELQDTTMKGCAINRGSSKREDFLMVNAFVTEMFFGIQVQPSVRAAEEINTEAFLLPLLDACEEFHNKSVNIVSVDFWDAGNLTALVDKFNTNLARAAIGNSTGGNSTSTNSTYLASLPPSDEPSSAPRLRKQLF